MKKNLTSLFEDILIILAIFSLWPIILGWQGIIFKVIPYLALGVMAAIFVRRMRRVRTFEKKS